MEEIVTLINRARSGDAEAYGVLVSRFQDMAYGYAYAVLSDFHLAQDAAQEAFVEAYQCLPSLREDHAFPAWLKRIVHKHCDRLTRRKRLPTAPLDVAAEVASSHPTPVEIAERHELAQRVQDAIRDLPDKQRVVTTLFYINGYSHNDIAEFLEVPAKTVKSRLHSSRVRLRERMIDMVEDELRSNKLSEDFTRDTVREAVGKAKELSKENKYKEAEEVLRDAMTDAPGNPQLLKELNHALMQGRVYRQDRWDTLPELVKQGREILKSSDDEYVRHEIARTLLAIPAMPEAVEFIEGWIAGQGPNLERLGMLAWAKGCTADYEAAESLWQEFLELSSSAEREEVLFHVPFVAYTLVDCFARAGESARAQRVAKEGWGRCKDLGTTSAEQATQLSHHRGISADLVWFSVFYESGLDFRSVADTLMERYRGLDDLRSRGMYICMRRWVDDPNAVLGAWLDWARECISAGRRDLVQQLRGAMMSGFWAHNDGKGWVDLAQATWEVLGKDDSTYWSWERLNPLIAIFRGDLDAAEEITKRDIEEHAGEIGYYGYRDLIALFRGQPTPPEVLEAVRNTPPGKWTFCRWYVIARESAAARDKAEAFAALRKALSYWTNGPYAYMDRWENDPRWGELRNDPEFKAAFDEKRKRIGPVYGALHYFPGW